MPGNKKTKAEECNRMFNALRKIGARVGSETIREIKTFKCSIGTPLVAQGLGVHLPMQGTRVREDPTCLRAAGPKRHGY